MSVSDKSFLAKLNYETFLKEYPIIEFNNPKAFNYWIEKVKQAEELMLNEHRFYVLFNHIKFHPIYLSKNFYKTVSCEPEELMDPSILFTPQLFHSKQMGAMLNFVRWGLKFDHDYKDKITHNNHVRYYCGLKLKHKNGTFLTTFLKQKTLLTNKKSEPVLSLIEMEDITHLYKSLFYWNRIIAQDDSFRITRFYVSKGSKKIYRDILSKRELEILQLCAQKKGTKEMGSILGISVQTVLKHRKNMIARTGVKDITGLLHICNLCDLI